MYSHDKMQHFVFSFAIHIRPSRLSGPSSNKQRGAWEAMTKIAVLKVPDELKIAFPKATTTDHFTKAHSWDKANCVQTVRDANPNVWIFLGTWQH